MLSHVWSFAILWTGRSLPGSSVHGTLQARILEWVAIPFSRGSSQPRDQTQDSHLAGRFFTIWAMSKISELFFYWGIVDLQCLLLLYSRFILFHYGLSQDIEYPVLHSRTLLFTHSVYTSLHPLIPNSQSNALTPLPLGNHQPTENHLLTFITTFIITQKMSEIVEKV